MQTVRAIRERNYPSPGVPDRTLDAEPGPSLTPVEKNLAGQVGGARWRGAKRT
jgi:hypothetical protein